MTCRTAASPDELIEQIVAATPANSPNPTPLPQQPVLCGGTRLRGAVAASTPEHPLVTVITAVLNAQPYIAGCIDSVLRQDYPNIEHVVIDGGSSDGTIDVLRAYDDRVAFWKSEADRGVYDAWNKALAGARGEWICFLGADDEFLSGAVTAYMALAAANPHADYLSSQIRWIHASGYTNPAYGRPWTWPAFAKSMCVAHPGSMHRRSLFDRSGTFDVSYRSAADYEFLLRQREHLSTAFMPLPTVIMRAGGLSNHANAPAEAYRAKVTTGGRNPVLATLELWAVRARLRLQSLRRAVARNTTEWSK